MSVFAAALGIGALQAALGIGAAKDAESAELENARLERDTADEEIRRRRLDQDRQMGYAKALAHAAGIEVAIPHSTPSQLLGEIGSQFKQELDWMEEWRDRSFSIAGTNASNRRRSNTLSSIFGGLQTGMSIYKGFG